MIRQTKGVLWHLADSTIDRISRRAPLLDIKALVARQITGEVPGRVNITHVPYRLA